MSKCGRKRKYECFDGLPPKERRNAIERERYVFKRVSHFETLGAYPYYCPKCNEMPTMVYNGMVCVCVYMCKSCKVKGLNAKTELEAIKTWNDYVLEVLKNGDYRAVSNG